MNPTVTYNIEQRLQEFRREIQAQIDELDDRYDAQERERQEIHRTISSDHDKIIKSQRLLFGNQRQMVIILERHEKMLAIIGEKLGINWNDHNLTGD